MNSVKFNASSGPRRMVHKRTAKQMRTAPKVIVLMMPELTAKPYRIVYSQYEREPASKETVLTAPDPSPASIVGIAVS